MSPKVLHPEDYKSVIDVPLEGVVDGKLTFAQMDESTSALRGDSRYKDLLIPEDVLNKRIDKMVDEICTSETKRVDILIVLTGAFMFAADLGRRIFKKKNTEVFYHYIKLSTYSAEIKQAGETERKVNIEFEPDDLKGRDIVVVEDILDQGFTLTALKKYLYDKHHVKSIRICTLLLKNLNNPSEEVIKIRKELDPEIIGFTVPDVWVAGYGIDAGNDFRYLPFIIDVNEQHYLNNK